jgi:hypothetical protein
VFLEEGELLRGGYAALAGIEGGAQFILDLSGMATGALFHDETVPQSL